MIPEGWKTYKLGDFIDINPSVHLKKDEKFSFIEMKDLDSTRKYVTPSCKKKLAGGAKFCNGDTLFARITPCLENGKICQARNIETNCGFGSTEFIVLRGKKDISISNFVYYLSRSKYIRNAAIQNMTGTSGRQRVETSAFAEIDFIAPLNLTVQSRIASILTSLDDKIELNLQMNQTLEAIAQAIFKEWFVDFRFPGFDGEMVDGLPKGWREGRYSDLASIETGKGLKREEYTSNGQYPVAGANGVIGHTNKYLYDERLILTGRVGTLGQIKISMGKCWISDNVLISNPNQYFFYTYYVLKSINLIALNRGSTQPLITQTDLKNQPVILPDDYILESFEDLVVDLYYKMHLNDNQNKTLTLIRDNLLPGLMTGKIRVA